MMPRMEDGQQNADQQVRTTRTWILVDVDCGGVGKARTGRSLQACDSEIRSLDVHDFNLK
jgi:hypothetical protein